MTHWFSVSISIFRYMLSARAYTCGGFSYCALNFYVKFSELCLNGNCNSFKKFYSSLVLIDFLFCKIRHLFEWIYRHENRSNVRLNAKKNVDLNCLNKSDIFYDLNLQRSSHPYSVSWDFQQCDPLKFLTVGPCRQLRRVWHLQIASDKPAIQKGRRIFI